MRLATREWMLIVSVALVATGFSQCPGSAAIDWDSAALVWPRPYRPQPPNVIPVDRSSRTFLVGTTAIYMLDLVQLVPPTLPPSGDYSDWWALANSQTERILLSSISSPDYSCGAIVTNFTNATNPVELPTPAIGSFKNGSCVLPFPFSEIGVFQLRFILWLSADMTYDYTDYPTFTTGMLRVVPRSSNAGQVREIAFLRFADWTGLFINSTILMTVGYPMAPVAIQAIGIDLNLSNWLSVNTSLLVEVINPVTGGILDGALERIDPIPGQIYNNTLTWNIKSAVVLRQYISGDVYLQFRLNATNERQGPLNPKLLLKMLQFRAPASSSALDFDKTQTFPRLWPSTDPLPLTSGVVIPEIRVKVLDSTYGLDTVLSNIVAVVSIIRCNARITSGRTAPVIGGTIVFQNVGITGGSTIAEDCMLKIELAGNRSLPLLSRIVTILPPTTVLIVADIALYSPTFTAPVALALRSDDFTVAATQYIILDSLLKKRDSTLLQLIPFQVNASDNTRLLSPSPTSVANVFVRDGPDLTIPARYLQLEPNSLLSTSYTKSYQTTFQLWTRNSLGGLITLSVPVMLSITSGSSTSMRFALNSPAMSGQSNPQLSVELGKPLPLIFIEMLGPTGLVDRTNNETRVTAQSNCPMMFNEAYSYRGEVYFTRLTFTGASCGSARLTFTAGQEGRRAVAGQSLVSGSILIVPARSSSLRPGAVGSTYSSLQGMTQTSASSSLTPTMLMTNAVLVLRDWAGTALQELYFDPKIVGIGSLPPINATLESLDGSRIYLQNLPNGVPSSTGLQVRANPSPLLITSPTITFSLPDTVATFPSGSLTYSSSNIVPVSEVTFCLTPAIALTSCTKLRLVPVFGASRLPNTVLLTPAPTEFVSDQLYNLSGEVRGYRDGPFDSTFFDNVTIESAVELVRGSNFVASPGGGGGGSALNGGNGGVLLKPMTYFQGGRGQFANLQFADRKNILVDAVTTFTFTQPRTWTSPKFVQVLLGRSAPVYVQPQAPYPSTYPIIVFETYTWYRLFDVYTFQRGLADVLGTDPARLYINRYAAGRRGIWDGTRVELQIVPPRSQTPVKTPTDQLTTQALTLKPNCDNAKFDLIRVSTLNGDPNCDHNYFLDRIESARHCEAFLGRASRCNCFLDTFLEMGAQCTHDSLMPPVCLHLSRCLDDNIQKICSDVTTNIVFQVAVVVSGCIAAIILVTVILVLKNRRGRLLADRPNASKKTGLLRRGQRKVRMDEIIL